MPTNSGSWNPWQVLNRRLGGPSTSLAVRLSAGARSNRRALTSIVPIHSSAKWVVPEDLAGALSFVAGDRPKVKPLGPAGLETVGFNPIAGRPFGVTNSAVYHLSS